MPLHVSCDRRHGREGVSVPKVCRVLIVEDDPDVQQVFDMALERDGYEFAVARDGPSMQHELATKGEFDIAIIDVMLPGGVGGLALAQQAAARGCGIILVTGHHDHYELVEKSGHRFLFKPFRLNSLLELVEVVLQETRARCEVKGGRRVPIERRGSGA